MSRAALAVKAMHVYEVEADGHVAKALEAARGLILKALDIPCKKARFFFQCVKCITIRMHANGCPPGAAIPVVERQ